MLKRKLLITFLTIITVLATFLGVACKPKDSTDDSSSSGAGGGGNTGISHVWTDMPENTNPNLKYFGYFHSDGFRSQPSYIEEIATLQNSNVVLINSAFSLTVAQERIALAKSLGFKVIFSVHGFFTGGQITKANSASLVSDYTQVWQNAVNALDDYVKDGTILAFYFDEPAWNGVKEADFRTVTKMIRETYPNTKVLTTMTVYDIGVAKKDGYPEINATYNEYCTDVSYDSYAKWNPQVRKTYLEALKTKATNNQYIWGCATGFTTNPEITSELTAAIKGMYLEAIEEPRYAGILPFSYANGQEGDWGYGLTTFFDNTNAFYDRELRQLYIAIGREICGMEPYDFSQDVEIIIYEPEEVFSLGEEIDIPTLGATDGLGNGIEFEVSITSPSGQNLPLESIVATESGNYAITVTAGEGDHRTSKTVYIPVRYPNEISLFDTDAYISDAGGTDADTWCWPRQIDTTFSHTGSGSLKITPHATDGTWPRVIFERSGNKLWDITATGGVSMWVYNASDSLISGFALMVSNENMDKSKTVYSFVDLPAKQWTEVVLDIASIKASKDCPEDLTRVTIFYGNAVGDYKNRGVFYIDDVTFIEQPEDVEEDGVIDFERTSDAALVGGSDDDVWCWPNSVSTELAHSGTHSLKVTPHETAGTWINVVFGFDGVFTHDLTNVESISVWVYFDSVNATSSLGFKIVNHVSGDNEGSRYEQKFNIPARTWTQVSLDVSALKNSPVDLSEAYIKFSQLDDPYVDRSPFYLDDLTVVFAEGEGNEGGEEVTEKYEKGDRLAYVTYANMVMSVGENGGADQTVVANDEELVTYNFKHGSVEGEMLDFGSYAWNLLGPDTSYEGQDDKAAERKACSATWKIWIGNNDAFIYQVTAKKTVYIDLKAQVGNGDDAEETAVTGGWIVKFLIS